MGACRPSTLARSTRPPKQSKAAALSALLREARARGEGLVHEPVEEHERLEHDLCAPWARTVHEHCCAALSRRCKLRCCTVHGARRIRYLAGCTAHSRKQMRAAQCRVARSATDGVAPTYSIRCTDVFYTLHRRIQYVARARVGTARHGRGHVALQPTSSARGVATGGVGGRRTIASAWPRRFAIRRMRSA